MRELESSMLVKHFFRKTSRSRGLPLLLLVFISVLTYVTIDSWKSFSAHHHSITHHQDESRESWESNPDKHPHRMAHFGSFIFRQQHPLSIFDSGLESYTGNSIFLEAHKQNTANFSEASLSTGLVRFGDLNIAMLLQLILPLIIFFIGYSSITSEKENGTLKMIYIQGTSMRQILLGKAIGLFCVAALFFMPSFFCLWSMSFIEIPVVNSFLVLRSILITGSYILYYLIICCITVLVSAISANSNKALLSLLGFWLLFFIILPKTAQQIGSASSPNLSKIEFKAAIEAEILKQGDSHNPNDPYFNRLRDSVLQANNVDDVNDLPFNYSGFIMSKGEEQTAVIYQAQHDKLIQSYGDQNILMNRLALINPYQAIKNLSMGLSATDFETYVDFLDQVEAFRYKQSQYLNDLQMKFISNTATSSEGKTHVVEWKYWKDAPVFEYEYLSIRKTLIKLLLPIFSLCFYMVLMMVIVLKFSHRFKII